MGCGSSKEEATEGTELRPQTAQRRQPGTSSHVPQSRRGAGATSQRGPGAATAPRGHTREGTARSSNSRHRELTTAQRQEHQARRRSRVPETIVETEDRVIHHGLNSLATMINQHSLNFYSASSGLTSREIGRGIVNDAIMRGIDGTPPHIPRFYFTKAQLRVIARTVANDLSSRLKSYTSGQTEEGRDAHLLQLCRDGVDIRNLIANHPSTWSFGPWGTDVRFPSVLRDGHEVVGAKFNF